MSNFVNLTSSIKWKMFFHFIAFLVKSNITYYPKNKQYSNQISNGGKKTLFVSINSFEQNYELVVLNSFKLIQSTYL